MRLALPTFFYSGWQPAQHVTDKQFMTESLSPVGRSMSCNGKLISQLRKAIGWTQSDLARRAGFTERLIVKAEASQSIAASTLCIIAETLSEAGAAVSSQELSVDPADRNAHVAPNEICDQTGFP